MKPCVSILVPIYRVPEKFLRQCIESLINQTLKNIEIILVDDGSPDNCGEICDEYAKFDKRIKVIHKKNEGLSAARNEAFFSSEGEYITFVDGDDYLEEKTCEIAYKIAKQENLELVFWDQITEYPNTSKVIITDKCGSKKYIGKECKILQERVLNFNGRLAQVFSKLINREYLIKYNIIHKNELKQGAEGIVFNIILFEYLNSAYYINMPLYHYNYNDNSISHSHNEENYYLIIKCFEEIKKFISTSKNKEKLFLNFYNRIIYVIVTTGISGYFNCENKEKYSDKVNKYKKFLEQPLILEALKKANMDQIDIQRKIIIFCIKIKWFWPISILAKIRRMQMKIR